jgi:hypothetical protein
MQRSSPRTSPRQSPRAAPNAVHGGSTLPGTGLIWYAKAPGMVDSIGLLIEELYPLVDPALRTIISADGGTTKRDDADIITAALASALLNSSTMVGSEDEGIAFYAYLTTPFSTLSKAARYLKGTWVAPSGPTAFTFTDSTGAELSTLTESAAITVAGLDVAVWFTVSGGEAEVNDSGTWVTSGVVVNTDTVKVRRTSSEDYETAVSVVLDINGVTDTWSLTTKSATSIASIFASGEYGGAYDFTDASTLTKDSANVIQTAGDIAPRSNDLTMATTSRRPKFATLPSSVGAQLLVNPRFDSDTEYSKGTGWTIADGKATKTAGTASSLSVPVSFEAGETYIVFCSILRSAGTLRTKFTGGTEVLGPTRNINSSFFDILVAATGNTTLEIYGDASFAGSVSNLTLNKVASGVKVGLFDGVDDQLQTTMLFGDSHQATIALSMWQSDQKTAAGVFDLAGFVSPVVPIASLMETAGASRVRLADGTNIPVANFLSGEIRTRQTHNVFVELDTTQLTIESQIKPTIRKISCVNTTSGTVVNDSAFGDGTFTVGGGNNGLYDYCGTLRRVFVINRLLSSVEKEFIHSWLNPGGIVAVLGDSTVASTSTTSGVLSECYPASAMLFDYECSGADISKVGDKIADQKTSWQALEGKSHLNAVIVQVGLNDINTYAITKTTAQIIADLQDLIDTIRADVTASCKIIISALTPCRGWIGNANDPAVAYSHWLAVNDAIAGNGSNPIAGVDARVTGNGGTSYYWNQLNDGSGYLLDIYDHNADEAHISTEARWYVAQEWRTALQSLGV